MYGFRSEWTQRKIGTTIEFPDLSATPSMKLLKINAPLHPPPLMCPHGTNHLVSSSQPSEASGSPLIFMISSVQLICNCILVSTSKSQIQLPTGRPPIPVAGPLVPARPSSARCRSAATGRRTRRSSVMLFVLKVGGSGRVGRCNRHGEFVRYCTLTFHSQNDSPPKKNLSVSSFAEIDCLKLRYMYFIGELTISMVRLYVFTGTGVRDKKRSGNGGKTWPSKWKKTLRFMYIYDKNLKKCIFDNGNPNFRA